MLKRSIFAIIILCLFIGSAFAQLEVNQATGIDDGSSPFATIQAAMNAASEGDTISITDDPPVTYSENVVFTTASLTLQGNGNTLNAASGFTLQDDVYGGQTVFDLNITGGRTVWMYPPTPTVAQNTFTSCTIQSTGEAITSSVALKIVLENCTVQGGATAGIDIRGNLDATNTAFNGNGAGTGAFQGFLQTSTFTLCSFENFYNQWVFNVGGDLTFIDSAFVNCHTPIRLDQVASAAAQKVTAIGSTLSGVSGGIVPGAGDSVYLEDCTMDGGPYHLSMNAAGVTTLTITNSRFLNCTGGSINYGGVGGSVMITGSTFSSNAGYDLRFYGDNFLSPVTVEDCTFDGGGEWMRIRTNITGASRNPGINVTSCTVTNKPAANGFVLDYVDDTEVNFTSVTMQDVATGMIVTGRNELTTFTFTGCVFDGGGAGQVLDVPAGGTGGAYSVVYDKSTFHRMDNTLRTAAAVPFYATYNQCIFSDWVTGAINDAADITTITENYNVFADANVATEARVNVENAGPDSIDTTVVFDGTGRSVYSNAVRGNVEYLYVNPADNAGDPTVGPAFEIAGPGQHAGAKPVGTRQGDTPSATSIIPDTAGPLNAGDTVTFTVVFSEAVVNFDDASDMLLFHNGTADGSFGGFTTSDNTTYSVTLTGVTGEGTYAVEVNTASDVQAQDDAAAIGVSVRSADIDVDNTAPAFDSRTPDSGAIVRELTTVTLNFTESVTGVAAGDLTVAGSPATTLDGTGAGPYTFTGFAAPPEGVFSVTLTSGSIVDAAGNAFATTSWNVELSSLATLGQIYEDFDNRPAWTYVDGGENDTDFGWSPDTRIADGLTTGEFAANPYDGAGGANGRYYDTRIEPIDVTTEPLFSSGTLVVSGPIDGDLLWGWVRTDSAFGGSGFPVGLYMFITDAGAQSDTSFRVFTGIGTPPYTAQAEWVGSVVLPYDTPFVFTMLLDPEANGGEGTFTVSLDDGSNFYEQTTNITAGSLAAISEIDAYGFVARDAGHLNPAYLFVDDVNYTGVLPASITETAVDGDWVMYR